MRGPFLFESKIFIKYKEGEREAQLVVAIKELPVEELYPIGLRYLMVLNVDDRTVDG